MRRVLFVLLFFACATQASEFSLATFDQLKLDAAKLAGHPLRQTPFLFILPEPAFSQMACHTGPLRCTVQAVTFPNGVIVANISKLDLDTVEGQAIIVHELVHVTQTFQQTPEACFADERQAYDAAAKWAAERGVKLWNPTDAEVKTFCLHEVPG